MTTEDNSKKGNSGGYQKSTPINTSQSDIRSIARAELNILRKDLKSAINRTTDPMSKYHLQDAVEQIELILNPNS